MAQFSRETLELATSQICLISIASMRIAPRPLRDWIAVLSFVDAKHGLSASLPQAKFDSAPASYRHRGGSITDVNIGTNPASSSSKDSYSTALSAAAMLSWPFVLLAALQIEYLRLALFRRLFPHLFQKVAVSGVCVA